MRRPHANAHDLVAAVRDRVRAFQQAADAADDVTLVAVGAAAPAGVDDPADPSRRLAPVVRSGP